VRPLRLLLLLLLARTLFALETPPAPTRWFTDTAGILNTTEAAILDTKLKDFEQSSGAQFIIYTLPTIGDDAIEDFTVRTARQWRVGQKKYDNGLIMFVFVQDKKVRIEVGYGLEGTVTDAVSARVIREQIAPHFQKGEYAAGLNAAADELIRRISTGEKPVPPLQPTGGQPQPVAFTGTDIGILLFIAIVFFLIMLPLIRRSRRGCGSSGCGGCFPLLFPFSGGGFGGGGITFGGGGFGGGFGGGGGGFSGGGGGFGGGGATGGW
jgi:uncharacterized protein